MERYLDVSGYMKFEKAIFLQTFTAVVKRKGAPEESALSRVDGSSRNEGAPQHPSHLFPDNGNPEFSKGALLPKIIKTGPLSTSVVM